MAYYGYNTYLQSGGCNLFTSVMLPSDNGKFPIVVKRSPYVNSSADLSDEEVLEGYMKYHEKWLKRGYGVVIQHCRGRGKSDGECEPFINEREDGLNLLNYIRNLSLYNGELFLWGGSYCCEVHLATAPFSDDIKGAIFRVKDTERYNFCFRNGMFKAGLFGDWFVTEMYKVRNGKIKNYSINSFNTLPFSDFSKTVYGENAPIFDEFATHPDRNDPFWNTHLGGICEKDALKNVKFPVLIESSLYDIFMDGSFDMWQGMSDEAKKRCAFIVSAYNHPDTPSSSPIIFPNASRNEKLGDEYDVDWCDYVRGKREPNVLPGKVTCYNLFLNKWTTDDFYIADKSLTLSIGEDLKEFTYNPYDPPVFNCGLSANFGNRFFEDAPGRRYDILTVYTEPFSEDTLVRGNMKLKLKVSSDCEDTSFYARISVEKEEGDYGLREDILTLCHNKDYIPNEKEELLFNFDEHSFLIKKGERLRIDISSGDAKSYVRHTNNKGPYYEHKTAKIAHNKVYFSESSLELPVLKCY